MVLVCIIAVILVTVLWICCKAASDADDKMGYD